MTDAGEQQATAGTTPTQGTPGADVATVPQGIPGLAELGRPLEVHVRALVLDNFKSFMKKTRIPMRDGFTTVSGPNGSGKSNVIDAMQFVLGIATSKGMRAERLTDLICTEGNRPSARVSLEVEGTFEKKDGTKHTRVFEVTRVVRKQRSGAQAHYEVDGTPVRLTDLHDLMRDLGFPTSGQNIVLQGDVVRLTSMGSVARRQVLDELAGARDFDKRIALAHEELGAADRLTEDTRLILEELAKRLVQLKVERDQALAFQELAGRKGRFEEDLVVLEVTEAEVKAKTKGLEIVEAEKSEKQLGRKREKQDAEAEVKAKELEAVEAELAAKGDGERMAQIRAVETLRGRVASTRERGQQARLEEGSLTGRLPQLARAVDETEQRLAGLTTEADRLGTSLEEREGRHEGLKRRFEGVAATLRRHSADQVRAAEGARAINQELDGLRGREAELGQRDRALGELASRAETELTLIAGSQGEGATRKLELDGLVKTAADEHKAARAAAAQLEEKRGALRTSILGLRSGLETAQAKVSRAEQELAAAEARRATAASLGGGDALATLRREGFEGIHGTVADLIRFDPRHAQAIEAAAGGRLSWVVVDDEQVARDAIECLRRTRAGRLTFAPLTKVRGQRNHGDAPRGRGMCGYAVDLVEVAPKYEELIREVFTDTVVVDSMNDGMPLLGRYRMVTLTGDVLERRGLMTGGAATRGGQMLQVAARAAEEIEEKKRALSELEAMRSAARGSLAKVEGEYAALDEAMTKARGALAGAESKLSSLAGELSRLEQTLGPKGDRQGQLEEQLKKARAEQAEIAGSLERVRAAIADAAGRLATLDAPTDSGAIDELSRQATAVEQEMRELETELGQLRQELSDVQGERRAAEERLESARTALLTAKAQLERVQALAATAEAEAQALAEELKVNEAALEQLASELAALARRRDAAREAAQAARDAAREAARELEVLAQKLAALKVELAALTEAAALLRKAAAERGVEVPGVEEAPEDLGRARRRVEQALAKVEAEITALGPVNQLAIPQYDEVVTRHEELGKRIATLEEEKTQLRARIVDLDGRKRTAFLDAFGRVSKAFQGTFLELARGEGRLRLENDQDPFAGGLIIEARPRGKKLSRLELMSGGEKSLTALAFIFALQEVNPAPFFVFDEVDQSLDGVNTEILATAIQSRAAQRQYLVISHHRVMLERSNHTIGVTMRKGHGTVVTGVEMAGEGEGEAEAEAAPAAGAPEAGK